MHPTDSWASAIRDVENEYFAIELGSDYLHNAVAADPTLLWKDIRAEFYQEARDNLQPTYLVRLFAVFENGLRDYWLKSVRGGTWRGGTWGHQRGGTWGHQKAPG